MKTGGLTRHEDPLDVLDQRVHASNESPGRGDLPPEIEQRRVHWFFRKHFPRVFVRRRLLAPALLEGRPDAVECPVGEDVRAVLEECEGSLTRPKTW